MFLIDRQQLQQYKMPRITEELIAQQLHYLKQKMKKLLQQERNNEAQKVVEKILSLDPSNTKMMDKYIEIIKLTKNKDKVYQVYEFLIKNDRNNLNMYKQYIDSLIEDEQYSKVKTIIKNAIKIDDSQPNLYIKFAKVSHRSKTFHDGLEILQQYQKKYRQESKTNQKILLWRVYLSYQIAKYQDAYNFSDIILKLPDLSAQDFDYYMIQKCKYCALLGKYEQSIKIGNTLLQKLAVHQKNKLKVHALKAYCHYKMDKKNQILPILLSAININPKDQMINYKWCLFKVLIYELPTSEKQEQENKKQISQIKIRIMRFLKKIEQCDQQNFQNTKLSDHFNWYSELHDYYTHVKFLYDALQNIGQILIQVQKLANNLFLSLLQGYQDCLRTNTILIDISLQICGKLKLSKQQNNKNQLIRK